METLEDAIKYCEWVANNCKIIFEKYNCSAILKDVEKWQQYADWFRELLATSLTACSTIDLISRQVAIDAIMGEYPEAHYPSWYADIIEKLPNAQPERETGYWIPVTNGRGGYECDKCHNYAPSYQNGEEFLSDFCPNCGAKMEVNR